MACASEQTEGVCGPSSSSEPWLFCGDELQTTKYPYDDDTEHWGKWMTYHSRATIDEAWGKAKEYYCAGLFDGVSSMKASGVGTEPVHTENHVIIYYCAHNDSSLWRAIGERVVNIMEYDRPCYYKTDTNHTMARAVVYRSAKKHASVMNVAPFEAPSSSSDRWLYCIDELETLKYPYNYDDDHWGKWMTFHSRASIDEAWDKAKEYYRAGLLDGVSSMQVSGVGTELKDPDNHVIIYYCDYNDASSCSAIGERVVNIMKYDRLCYYTTGTNHTMPRIVVYRSAEKRPLVMPFGAPSSSSDRWLYCIDGLQLTKYPQNDDPEHWGKWMTFHSRESIDEEWEDAIEFYYRGLLAGVSSMKVSGVRTENEHSDNHVIIYYCAYNDASLCKAIGERVVGMMEYDRPCYYKLDAMTLADQKCESLMEVAPFAELEAPSSSSKAWLYCHDELQMMKYSQNDDDEHWGKWMTFHSRASIDKAWDKAKEYYRAGLLDGVSIMNVSGTGPKPEHQPEPTSNHHVIIYFCDYNDASLCKAIGERVVNMMKYNKECYYKTDAMTLAGVYRSLGFKRASVMKVAPFQSSEAPSSFSDHWLYYRDELHAKKYPYNHDTEHWGKWMTFHSRESIDEKWGKAKEFYCAGLFDGVGGMKVSCVGTGVGTESEHERSHVIIYYCDYNDASLCRAIGERVVNIMKYDRPCYYKTDAMTRAGVYRSAGYKRASVMNVAPFEESSSSSDWHGRLLFCRDELQMTKYPYKHDTEHWGKWMTFHSRASINETWENAKEYYCTGLLDGVSCMKVCRARTESEHERSHVIIYYCAYNDASLCKAIGERVVNMMKYDRPCYYKTDAMTLAGVDHSAGERVSVMTIAQFDAA